MVLEKELANEIKSENALTDQLSHGHDVHSPFCELIRRLAVFLDVVSKSCEESVHHGAENAKECKYQLKELPRDIGSPNDKYIVEMPLLMGNVVISVLLIQTFVLRNTIVFKQFEVRILL